MRNISKKFWLAGLISIVSASAIFGTVPAAQTVNPPADGVVTNGDDDEDVVKARVARISFISGEVKIKRVDNDEWEKAVLNLPLVEGDEIATGADSRLEMQLNNHAHIRLDSEAYLKFSVLKDQGVAVSLTQGTLALRITNFEKAGGYYEIDAPKTTIAIEKSGSYRIDAGRAGDSSMNVSVRDGGSARVYSDDAGFTLKSGRSARVFIDGANAGEWETADVARVADDFDSWSENRDSAIAKRLKSAYYDKYYDQDIYGADDLNDNGEWIYTSTYGYVWKPYSSAISGYPDWSPYRYGHWRWVPQFGWTWVNDEPWGWATYHHGRWVYDRGHWVWCPYSYYRPKRSWWFPALVTINIINTNVCWYPIGYHRRWRNYNHHNGGWGGGPRNTDRDPRNQGGVSSTDRTKLPGDRTPVDEIPGTGIIALDRKDFGTGRQRPTVISPILAKKVLTDTTDRIDLPDRKQVTDRMSRDIVTSKPRVETVAETTRTGAATRRTDAPLDEELRTKRILGGRQRMETPIVEQQSTDRKVRPTGAVERPATPIIQAPTDRKIKDAPDLNRDRETMRQPRIETPRVESTDRKPSPPRYDPPPVYNPPPRSEPSTDRQPAPRNDPPPKAEPKPESKPVERPTDKPSPKQSPKDGR